MHTHFHGPRRDRDEGRARPRAPRSRHPGTPWRWLFPIVGLLALLWFLVRVIPKPSRAAYPCQRAAFPLASAFVVWVASAAASVAALRRARALLADARYVLCALLVGTGVGSAWMALSWSNAPPLRADPPVPNAPIGEAKGLFPGRVAWVHEPDVTDWDGATGPGRWWYEHIDGGIAARMLSRAIRAYAGVDEEGAAWDAIFRHFNREKGRGDVGYTRGERFAIKLNLVACWAGPGSNRVDASYEKADSWKPRIDNTPELSHALLHQLVRVVGVAEEDIWIGDPTGWFPSYMYDKLHPDFPGVRYWDNRGTLGRTRAEYSDHPFHWSKPGLGAVRQDYVPTAYAEATYVINFAILKTHDLGGITTCGKNHYGSLIRLPNGSWQDPSGAWRSNPADLPYYDWHADLPGQRPGTGRYRNFVDFMGHADIGGKTVLCLIDAVIAGRNWEAIPEPWTLPPFDASDGWPSSLFVSMDPVAIDSVALDFLREQWPEHADMSGTDDYLVEAALANAPPSGAFYDPNRSGRRIPSLGAHERWNDPVEKRYSRNLDPSGGQGIELLRVDDDSAVIARAETPPGIDGEVDGGWNVTFWRPIAGLVDPSGGAGPDPGDLSAAWKCLWDDGNFYLLVEVTDDVLVGPAADDEPYRLRDVVEVFVDADGSLGGGRPPPNYDGLNDFALAFRWGDATVRTGDLSAGDAGGIVFAMEETAAGYRLEAAIPWSTLRARPAGLPPVAPGARIGIDVHVTDDDGLAGGDLGSALAWRSPGDEIRGDASRMEIVSLSRPIETVETLVPRGARWRHLEGRSEASTPTWLWRSPEHDDSSWAEGAAPFGYGDPPYGTLLADMMGSHSTVFLRRSFGAPEGAVVSSLAILADYDDGFIAWINGVEVARAGAPEGEPLHTSLAASNHESGAYERFALPDPGTYLVEGENAIAVQVFNVGLGSSDLKIDVELQAKCSPAPPSFVARFIRGDSNGDGAVDIADAVHILLGLFAGLPTDCDGARDVDDDGALQVTDAIVLLDFLFRGGAPPPEPFPLAGADPTPDALGCSR